MSCVYIVRIYVVCMHEIPRWCILKFCKFQCTRFHPLIFSWNKPREEFSRGIAIFCGMQISCSIVYVHNATRAIHQLFAFAINYRICAQTCHVIRVSSGWNFRNAADYSASILPYAFRVTERCKPFVHDSPT